MSVLARRLAEHSNLVVHFSQHEHCATIPPQFSERATAQAMSPGGLGSESGTSADGILGERNETPTPADNPKHESSQVVQQILTDLHENGPGDELGTDIGRQNECSQPGTAIKQGTRLHSADFIQALSE